MADVQADAAPENIAAEAKVGDEDEDMREVMRELAPEKRNLILRRRGIRVADWEAKEKRIDSSVWDTLRRKGAPVPWVRARRRDAWRFRLTGPTGALPCVQCVSCTGQLCAARR